jgi:hypothetical protein
MTSIHWLMCLYKRIWYSVLHHSPLLKKLADVSDDTSKRSSQWYIQLVMTKYPEFVYHPIFWYNIHFENWICSTLRWGGQLHKPVKKSRSQSVKCAQFPKHHVLSEYWTTDPVQKINNLKLKPLQLTFCSIKIHPQLQNGYKRLRLIFWKQTQFNKHNLGVKYPSEKQIDAEKFKTHQQFQELICLNS